MPEAGDEERARRGVNGDFDSKIGGVFPEKIDRPEHQRLAAKNFLRGPEGLYAGRAGRAAGSGRRLDDEPRDQEERKNSADKNIHEGASFKFKEYRRKRHGTLGTKKIAERPIFL